MALSDDQKDLLRALEKEARLRKEISTSVSDYVKAVNDSKTLEKEITDLYDKRSEAVIKLRDMRRGIIASTPQELKHQEDLVAALKYQHKLLKQNKKVLDDTIKSVDKYQLLVNRGLTKGILGISKAIGNLPNVIEGAYGKIKGYGLFEMDKAMKKTALSMGLAGVQSKNLRSNITSASEQTVMFGAGLEEVAQYQADYSEELGRSVMLGQKGLESIAAMAKGTTLGAEGAAKMAADFEQQGISAVRTKDFIEEAVNKSAKMGLNSSKVIKNMQANMKLLNKYNFKGGVKGLQKMAETTSKLGIDMNSIAGMADKLFDIEGAVEMSAQLQVMGGAWAQMADPFKLMYMARNDMAGLAEQIGEASKQSAHFNSETQQYEISAMEMHKLRIIAEKTGIAYDDLATAAKNARKLSDLRGQISFDMDKDTKEFLANTAQRDKDGRGYIDIIVDGKSTRKFISEMNDIQVKALMTEKQKLEERAKSAMTFDDTLKAATDRFKIALLPFVEKLGEKGGLIDSLQAFIKKATTDKWFEKIGELASSVGSIVTAIGKFILENPIPTLITYLTAWGGLKIATWVANGYALAQGFNAGAGAGSLGGALANTFGKIAGPLLAVSVGTAVAGLVGNLYDKIFGGKKSSDTWKENWGKKLGRLATTTAAGAGGGALVGSAFAGVGAVPGAVLGGIGGLGKGLYDEFISAPSMNDGIIKFNKNDKFTKVDDSTLVAGTNKNGNKDLANILKYGALSAIPGIGPALAGLEYYRNNRNNNNQNTSSGANIVKHEFGELKIDGKIVVTGPGGKDVGVDLLKDPMFIRELQSKLTTEIKRVENQVPKKG